MSVSSEFTTDPGIVLASLREKNYSQAHRIMFLEFAFFQAERELTEFKECWHVVGQTVYVDHARLVNLILDLPTRGPKAMAEARKAYDRLKEGRDGNVERRSIHTSKYL